MTRDTAIWTLPRGCETGHWDGHGELFTSDVAKAKCGELNEAYRGVAEYFPVTVCPLTGVPMLVQDVAEMSREDVLEEALNGRR